MMTQQSSTQISNIQLKVNLIVRSKAMGNVRYSNHTSNIPGLRMHSILVAFENRGNSFRLGLSTSII